MCSSLSCLVINVFISNQEPEVLYLETESDEVLKEASDTFAAVNVRRDFVETWIWIEHSAFGFVVVL